MEDEVVIWHHLFDGHELWANMSFDELGQTPEESEGQGSLACCSPWGHKGLDMT